MRLTPTLISLAAFLLPAQVLAFGGLFVSRHDEETKLTNNATAVVLAPEGTRTVMSIRPNYRGAAREFAMVIPVPAGIGLEDVELVSAKVFERLDAYTAPRLLEFWEKSPCLVRPRIKRDSLGPQGSGARSMVLPKYLGVDIETEFDVGEYDLEVLSAQQSSGLATWLRDAGFALSAEVENDIVPYVEAGNRFLVVRVDLSKIARSDNDSIELAPLQINYDSDEFSLPLRLGLHNAPDDSPQDVVIYTLGPGRAYEVANHRNEDILEFAELTRRQRCWSFRRIPCCLARPYVRANPRCGPDGIRGRASGLPPLRDATSVLHRVGGAGHRRAAELCAMVSQESSDTQTSAARRDRGHPPPCTLLWRLARRRSLV